MKAFSLLIVLFFVTQSWGAWSGGLRVRFDVGLFIGKNFFINVPRTVSEALNQRWVSYERPERRLSSLQMYCPGNRVLCALYDDNGNVCGLQIGIPKANFTDSIWNWDVQGFTSWTPPANSDGSVTSYWTIQQYFVNEEILALSQEERLARYDASKPLPYGALWVTGFNGELMKISGNEKDIAETLFTQQACIPWMGRHYYYNMSATTSCDSEYMLPWFPLVDSKELVGTGFVVAGKLPAESLQKDYFERPPQTAVKVIVPRGPKCLYEIAVNPGLLTMHIYYVNAPWLINCVF
ncbi:uncharacterized protein ACR2FA_003348 [Aphomia sociella]